MGLEPQMTAILDQMRTAGAAPLRAGTPEQARKAMDAMLRAFARTAEAVKRVEDRKISGPAGELPVRIYTPDAPRGILVFFHGGGWVLGGLDSHDALCRSLTNGAGCVTVSVDYRLAPEDKFPAAPEDCYAATKWAAENSSTLGVSVKPVAVGGDSAGGNLAAAVALMARDRSGPPVSLQLLIYPAIDGANETPSQKEFSADGYILSRADMEWFWGHYLESEADYQNPYACPSRAASLAGLPPAVVITAGFDPLRDEGEAYAEQMRQAGVKVEATRYPGVTHGFVSMAENLDEGKRALKQATAALRGAFER